MRMRMMSLLFILIDELTEGIRKIGGMLIER